MEGLLMQCLAEVVTWLVCCNNSQYCLESEGVNHFGPERLGRLRGCLNSGLHSRQGEPDACDQLLALLRARGCSVRRTGFVFAWEAGSITQSNIREIQDRHFNRICCLLSMFREQRLLDLQCERNTAHTQTTNALELCIWVLTLLYMFDVHSDPSL